jgi:hypothetical protein
MPTKRSKILSTKNIRRRKSNNAQSKQISTLATKVRRLTSTSYDKVRTRWQRNNLPIEKVGSTMPLIIPIPYAMNDPLAQGPMADRLWSDNNQNASQPTYTKQIVFGRSSASVQSNCAWHTGGTIKYQLICTEPNNLVKVSLFLISPKKKLADQLVKDRLMKNIGLTTYPGANSVLEPELDFTVHNGTGGSDNTYFGAEMNPKYWTTHFKRECTFNMPGSTAFATTTFPANTNPANNARTASGTIRIPAGGRLMGAQIANQTTTSNKSSKAMEVCYPDQSNENGCYLVAISNGSSADLETVDLGLLVMDYYKVEV